ncbi:hypothetical protein [Euzebya sp.]|uniref:hypothetical protein n=1 Tax=Euzebya sp. TaxID=1971409 RepID=UPI0035136668
MRNTEFNASFQALLRAFNAHEDLRRSGADLPALARSNYELHRARMAAYHASK